MRRLWLILTIILILLATILSWLGRRETNLGRDPVVMLKGTYTEERRQPDRLSVVGGKLKLIAPGEKHFFGCYGAELTHAYIRSQVVLMVGCRVSDGLVSGRWVLKVDTPDAHIKAVARLSTFTVFTPVFWDILGMLVRQPGPAFTAILLLVGILMGAGIKKHQPMVDTPLILYYLIAFGVLAMGGALIYLFGSGLLVRGMVEEVWAEVFIGTILVLMLVLGSMALTVIGAAWAINLSRTIQVALLVLSLLCLTGYWTPPLIILPPLGLSFILAREERV